MRSGLHKTCHVLSQTRNRAVVPLIVAGLRSSSSEVRAEVIRAAVRRQDAETHAQLLSRFAELDEADQELLINAHRGMPHHAAPVLRKAILHGDRSSCGHACEIVAAASDFESFSTLVKAAENRKHHSASTVLATMAALVDVLYLEMADWAGGARDVGRDPSFTRRHVLAALEHSLAHFAEHRRTEILDAFLLLAPVDNAMFLKILREPRHASHGYMLEVLAASQDSGIMERLADLLRDTAAPAAALRVIADRHDPQFVNLLLHSIKHPAPLRVLHNMNRIQNVAWLEGHRELLLDLDGRAQAVAVELAVASGINRESQFALFATLLREGMPEGRRASCRALASFNGAKANELILAAADDPDAGVQAGALRQLRPRQLPGALKTLVSRLDARSEEVREAARASLAEFNYVRYRSMFDLLDADAARTTGQLVHKIDHTACDKLLEDLASPSLAARSRAIEMAVAMAATEDVQEELMDLVRHENATLRREAVLALGHCRGSDIVSTLEAATRDLNGSVAEAARKSLAILNSARQRT